MAKKKAVRKKAAAKKSTPKKASRKKKAAPSRKPKVDSADGVAVGEEPVPGMRLRAICRGHTGTIGRIAWSPCGRFIASPSEDKTIRIWDTSSGRCLSILKGHADEVLVAAWSSQTATIASGSVDRTVRVWDVTTATQVEQLEGHRGEITALTWEESHNYLVSGANDNTFRIWQTASWQLREEKTMSPGPVHDLSYRPEDWQLAVSSGAHSVRLWTEGVQGGGSDETLYGHTGTVRCAHWSPDGQFLATGSDDWSIRIWDSKKKNTIRILEGHAAPVHSVTFLKDGRVLASRSLDGTIRFWCCESWTAVEFEVEHLSSGGPVAFSPKTDTIAVVGQTTIELFDIDVSKVSQSVRSEFSQVYQSAKVVLVGESNVGKSCLAMRLTENRYPEDNEHGTTHGMRFWPMAAEDLHPLAKPPKGQRSDLVLWDFGGQDEYQLVHQMFLHDTSLALVLIDPTRGRSALDEARTWNKRLENHLGNRKTVKLLVGAKADQESRLIDLNAIDALKVECGFTEFVDLSSKTGRNVPRLRKLIADLLDWDEMAKTSRPELFQWIRDDIESRRKDNQVVLLFQELEKSIPRRFVDFSGPFGQSIRHIRLEYSVRAVSDQLAAQGVIVRTKLTGGDEALVLQLPLIERYAGALIIAARNNPRGVPVLEERLLGSTNKLPLPGITSKERIAPSKERVVLECIVELMIQHGICFRHGGLLVFPTLFPDGDPENQELAHSVSLYYDFSGAIDNIYASLVAKLMVSEAFGEGRLWADSVEFDQPDKGVCGIRQRKRKGGLAHVDLFFAEDTATKRRELFTTFVDEHLRANGVSIQEHQAIQCRKCEYEVSEDIVQQRLALDHDDVLCPICGTETRITEGVEQRPARDHDSEQEIVALRKRIEDKTTRDVAAAKLAVSGGDSTRKKGAPIRLLHLSDLHFEDNTSPVASLQWLLQDLRNDDENFPAIKKIEYLVLSGDVTHRGDDGGFDKARQFVEQLIEELGLSSLRCVFVPGNHDVQRRDSCYQLQSSITGLDKRQYVKKSDVYLVRDEADYPNRLKKFSDAFYHKVTSSLDYPLAPEDQGMSYLFEDTGVQFLALNTAWEIDQFFPGRATVHPQALANSISKANKEVDNAIERGDMKKSQPRLRIGVFHHAINGPWAMQNLDFIGNLQAADVKLCLHGDVHEMRRQWIEHWDVERNLHVLGAGTFGAKRDDITEGSARSYNLLEIASDLKSLRAYVREQPKLDGAWRGWNHFPDPDGGRGKVPFFDIEF